MARKSAVFFIADDALGIHIGPGNDRHRLAAHLRQSPIWSDIIPGAGGLSVRYDPVNLAPAEAKAQLEEAIAAPGMTAQNVSKHWVIPVCYAPEFALDMDAVCAATGLSEAAIIAHHTEPTFQVDMIGFTPGFAYLKSDGFTLDLPRLPAPRQHVPAGAVGLARGQCGLYALDGPGGWPIIGRTDFALFAPDETDPFRLNPGDSVKFEPTPADAFPVSRS